MTERNFQEMLNEYLPNSLLREEMVKRDFVLTTMDKDENWKGGQLIVPFRGAHASSIKFGGLTNAGDISQSKTVRGKITDYVEVWGSMVFNHKDLVEHNGRINEDTFLSILPDEIEDFMDYMKQVVSIQLGSGPHFATITDATDAATGKFVVDRVDRFTANQKCVIDDGNSGATAVYVLASAGIDQNTSEVTFSLTRGGAAADLSAYSVAQSAKLYHDGVTDGSGNHTTFVSFRRALLSAANGGDATLHGVSKLAWPHLQALNINGATLGGGITKTNILDCLFDAYTDVRMKCKGNADTILLSWKHLGSILKLLETQKGPYIVTEDAKTSLYGWTEITIQSVKGKLKIVGIQEMDNDVIFYIDWKAMTFRTNGFFQKRKSPDGKEYYEVRAEDGFKYIVDVSLFGELEFRKPGHCAVIYNVPNYA